MDEQRLYSISEVVAATGVNANTLRSWERRKQLSEAPRSAAGHRLYTSADLDEIRSRTGAARGRPSRGGASGRSVRLQPAMGRPLPHPSVAREPDSADPGQHAAQPSRRPAARAPMVHGDAWSPGALVAALAMLQPDAARSALAFDGDPSGWSHGPAVIRELVRCGAAPGLSAAARALADALALEASIRRFASSVGPPILVARVREGDPLALASAWEAAAAGKRPILLAAPLALDALATLGAALGAEILLSPASGSALSS